MRNFQLPRFSVWQSTSIFFLHQKVFPLSLFFHFPITPWYRLEIFSIWLCNILILSNFPEAFHFWLESVFTFFFNAGFTSITTYKSILIYLGFSFACYRACKPTSLWRIRQWLVYFPDPYSWSTAEFAPNQPGCERVKTRYWARTEFNQKFAWCQKAGGITQPCYTQKWVSFSCNLLV